MSDAQLLAGGLKEAVVLDGPIHRNQLTENCPITLGLGSGAPISQFSQLVPQKNSTTLMIHLTMNYLLFV